MYMCRSSVSSTFSTHQINSLHNENIWIKYITKSSFNYCFCRFSSLQPSFRLHIKKSVWESKNTKFPGDFSNSVFFFKSCLKHLVQIPALTFITHPHHVKHHLEPGDHPRWKSRPTNFLPARRYIIMQRGTRKDDSFTEGPLFLTFASLKPLDIFNQTRARTQRWAQHWSRPVGWNKDLPSPISKLLVPFFSVYKTEVSFHSSFHSGASMCTAT